MAQLYEGQFGWAYTFKPNGKAPLDPRTVVLNFEDLGNLDTFYKLSVYEGMTASVVNDESIYVLIGYENHKNEIYKDFENLKKTNKTNAEIAQILWKKVGNGLGSITVNKYSTAKTKATSSNIGLIIYCMSEDKIDGLTYSSGPYIVIGEKLLQKLASSSSSGDVSSEIAALAGRVTTAEGNIESINTTNTLLSEKINSNTEALKTKVDTSDYNTKINSLESADTLNSVNINSLTERISNAESAITKNTANISTNKTDIGKRLQEIKLKPSAGTFNTGDLIVWSGSNTDGFEKGHIYKYVKGANANVDKWYQIITTETLDYEHSSISSVKHVKDALDKIIDKVFYVALSPSGLTAYTKNKLGENEIVKFTTYEHGTELSIERIDWNWNKTPISLTLTVGGTSVGSISKDAKTYSYGDIPKLITDTTEIKLTCGDTTDTGTPTTRPISGTFTFAYKTFYQAYSNNTTLPNNEEETIRKLGNSSWAGQQITMSGNLMSFYIASTKPIKSVINTKTNENITDNTINQVPELVTFDNKGKYYLYKWSASDTVDANFVVTFN